MASDRTLESEGIDQDRGRINPHTLRIREKRILEKGLHGQITDQLRALDSSASSAAVLEAVGAAGTARHRTKSVDQGQSTLAEAVIYLRVSTKEQAESGGETEGYSIPAQREACKRQAKELNAIVVDEYVDRGESARSANRPELQRLLEDIKHRPNIRYVIVHKIDRLARTREDDIAINVALRKADVQLVSCTERIDDSPSGVLLYGMMAELAQFYSRNLAQEVLKGLTQKAKSGGTPYRAPIGYVNVRRIEDGKDVRWVEIDEHRAPLVRWCFETYATGEWSTQQLLAEATRRGLRSRATAKYPAKALTLSGFCFMLKSPYYIGVVPYRGFQYRGQHEPLIDPEIWLRVQDVLAAHDRAGEKIRRHPHYLKGSIFCDYCKARLCFSRNRGHGGSYDYFFCLGKTRYRYACQNRYVAVDKVEGAVEDYYKRLQLSKKRVASIKTSVEHEMDQEVRMAKEDAARQTKIIAGLENERERLLQAYLTEAVPVEMLKKQMDRITLELTEARTRLGICEDRYADVKTVLARALELAGSCGAQYQAAPNAIRRQLNQGFFKAIYIDQEGRVARVELTEPFAALLAEDLLVRLEEEAKSYRRRSGEARQIERRSDVSTDRLSRWLGSNKPTLVETIGFEPTTPWLQTRCSTN